jgi:AAA+ ATPase superfamily predicted ATPase
MKPKNPFLTTGYYSPDYFCDRVEETRQMQSYLVNGQDVTLTSIRRMGKTGLIKHLFSQLPTGWKRIYIDILSTENLSQFLDSLATAVIQSVPEKESFGQRIWNFIKSMRPVISFDPLTYLPQASFDLKIKETETHISSILRFLEEQDFTIVVAIDEFQQITNYPEKNTDAWLRTIIQQMNNVKFIFSGSQQHIINELFNSPSRPFNRSTVMLNIHKINSEDYHQFIRKLFTQGGKTISDQVIDQMLEWADLHTFYVQLICNRAYSSGVQKITEEIWRNEAFKLLKELEVVFYNYRNMLTAPQWNLLKAIALDKAVYSPTSKDFIAKYGLGSPSTVLRSLKSLLDRDMVYTSYSHEGHIFYSIHDILFQHWAASK